MEEVTAVSTKTSVVMKDVVIKAEEVEEDSLVNTLTHDDYEPVHVKTVVKSVSDDYLSSLIKGNVKLSELGDGMKDNIILALCMKLAVHK